MMAYIDLKLTMVGWVGFALSLFAYWCNTWLHQLLQYPIILELTVLMTNWMNQSECNAHITCPNFHCFLSMQFRRTNLDRFFTICLDEMWVLFCWIKLCWLTEDKILLTLKLETILSNESCWPYLNSKTHLTLMNCLR